MLNIAQSRLVHVSQKAAFPSRSPNESHAFSTRFNGLSARKNVSCKNMSTAKINQNQDALRGVVSTHLF